MLAEDLPWTNELLVIRGEAVLDKLALGCKQNHQEEYD